jgi:methionyl-tRNA synthetase
MHTRTLITAALPYANGSLHLGHLVEYCLVDMYVRALRAQGHQAIYLCANDAHGTPIEVNAGKQGISPETLVARVHAEHKRDFARFDVAFDHFTTTHSKTNAQLVEAFYNKLQHDQELEEREVDGNWCETDQRFLPDRFIKGHCPRCDTPDQYGDVCESCSATYSPADLKAPFCVLCGKPPVVRRSRHVFFKLSQPEHIAFLRKWIDSGALQTDVANYVRNWIDSGLRDWCISRDGPYFGFAIPQMPNKYFYVWLDAPIGYVAAAAEWGEKNGVPLAELWQSDKTRVEHVIGKDIMYFHTLFWPAVLHAVDYTLPSAVHVHGMLTVNGEKMSKSRGTFINAATFADAIDPQALRFYYASKYTSQTHDMDLSFDDFLARINGELVNKHANLFSRVCQFLQQKLDGRLGTLPFSVAAAQQTPVGDNTLLDMAQQVVAIGRRIEKLYAAREVGQVVRELGAMADIGNETMQNSKPWVQLKEDPEAARLTCTFVANVCYALAMYLAPIVPQFSAAGLRMLGARLPEQQAMDAAHLFAERSRSIGALERLFERIDKKAVEAIVAASAQAPQAQAKQAAPDATGSVAPQPSAAAPKQDAAAGKAQIAYDTFAQLDLRVGHVLAAEAVPKSKKLLRLSVDLGEPEPRQIISGLAEAYSAQAMVGQQVVVVANLKPAKIMGHLSQGMVLAGGESPELALCALERRLPPGTRVS